MSFRGLFSGALALIALQAVVGSAKGANRLSQGGEWIANGIRAAMSPAVAAVPDLAGAGSGGSKGGHGKFSAPPT